MTTYQILMLFGAEIIIQGFFIWFWKQLSGTRKGVQALLRARMYDDYDKWNEKGYAPIHVKENFENCWNQYHKLGKNGVMDEIHQMFLKLPTAPKEYEE